MMIAVSPAEQAVSTRVGERTKTFMAVKTDAAGSALADACVFVRAAGAAARAGPA